METKKIYLLSALSEEHAKLLSKIGIGVKVNSLTLKPEITLEIPDESPLFFLLHREWHSGKYSLHWDKGEGYDFLTLDYTKERQSVFFTEVIIGEILKRIKPLRKEENPVVPIKTETVGDEKISTIGGKETDAEIQILVDKKISNKPETIGGKKTDPKIQILDEEKISTKTKTAGGKKTESERKKEKDLEPVTAKLNVFKAKEATFRQEASKQKNNKQHLKYNEAAQAVKKIVNALDLLISEYTGSNQNLDSFKAATQQMLESTDIKQDIKTLASHRGTKLLLLNILSAIITLGGSLIYGAAKGNYSLFRAPTDSNSKLQKVTDAIEKLPKKS